MAMKIVGDCYETGDGVEQSNEECLHWYSNAAKQGNREAASQLPFKKEKVAERKIANGENGSEYTDSQFRMTVQTISEIHGRGTVVEGVIEKGSVRTHDEVMITKKDGTSFQSVVLGIEFFRKILDYAEEGDNVNLLLRGIPRKDISKGDVVTKN